jgi:hypothetical protein
MGTLRYVGLFVFLLLSLSSLLQDTQTQKPSSAVAAIPKTWDSTALATLEVPLAEPSASPVPVSPNFYYTIPVRPIHKSYPKYHPDKEPRGYRDWLTKQEPVVLWDDGAHRPKLVTEEDWIKAGEMVFNAPLLFVPQTDTAEDMRAFIRKTGDLYDSTGVSPFATYVIRERGKLEIGEVSCAECHSRVMPDGTVIRGAQGNRPVEQVAYLGLAEDAANALDKQKFLAEIRRGQLGAFAAPWLRPDPNDQLGRSSAAEIEAIHFAIPASVFARQGTSPLSPAKVPDLIGTKERRYLDATGLIRHRSIGDLMRYAALNQGMDMLGRYGDFIPAGTRDLRQLLAGDPTNSAPFAKFAQARYSDEQLYALALYIYSLKPPSNPNKFDSVAKHGQKVFEREGCPACHTPPLYTNNNLTPAEGFTPQRGAEKKFDILPISVGTDPTLALKTRRGTGYYKVPSLKGAWYRGMFGHSGWCATLEDWFDPRRTRGDYVPTGFKPYGAKTYAVKGHPFGLSLSDEDRKALIAFLKTL